MKFFFAIDAGNTDITIALILNYKIHKKYRVKTLDFIKSDNINLLFKPFIPIVKKEIINNKIYCVVSCVVDKINNILKKGIYSFLRTKPLFISDNLLDKAQSSAVLKKGTVGISVTIMHAHTPLPDKIDIVSPELEEIAEESSKYKVGQEISPTLKPDRKICERI